MKNLLLLLAFAVGCAFTSCNFDSQPAITHLALSTEFSSGQPYLSKDAHGNIIMSWTETDTLRMNYLKYAKYNENSWSEAKTLAEGNNWFVNWADFPSVVQHPDGSLMAHYLVKSSQGTYSYDVHLANHTASGKFSNLLHHDSTYTEHGFVSIVPYKEYFFASWLDGRNTAGHDDGHDHNSHGHGGGPMSLRGALVDTQGNKVQEWELDSSVCDCCQTSAAVTPDGIIVAYRDRSGEEVRDISFVNFDGQSWSTPMTINNDQWQIKGCPVNGPKVASSGQNVALAWFTAADNNPRVHLKISTDGGKSFGALHTINKLAALGRVGLAMDNADNIFVSWMENEAEATLLKLKKLDSSGKVLASINIAQLEGSRVSGVPQIAVTNDEKIVAAWTEVLETKKKVKAVKVGF